MEGDAFNNLAFENYGIVAGGIYSSESEVKHPIASTPLQNTDRKYEGTVDGFASAFPGFIVKAAAIMSLDPKNYEQEVAYIVGSVRTCAGITPQMANGTRFQFPSGRYGPPCIF
jgi:hypothetical protein